MDFGYRWEIINKIDEGGQGIVHRAIDTKKYNIRHDIFPKILGSIQAFNDRGDIDSKIVHFEKFRKAMAKLIHMEEPTNHCALKVLHEIKDKDEYKKAEARIKREIKAMSEVSHPNLLKIIDYDPEGKWFVSEFHPKGTLFGRRRFTGDFVSALKAFRPLVEGVSELHKKGFVHRDIKSKNAFLDSYDNLVLGDFGLVFFNDSEHTRITGPLESVGSHDWMPAWLMGGMQIQIEDVKPTFDVFSLGKLLWTMVSSKPILRLWYFDREEFNLEKMFPNVPSIKLANVLFEKCIVEEENNCLPDAGALLKEVDRILHMIDRNADIIKKDVERMCKVCGVGTYKLIIDRERTATDNFGLEPHGSRSFKIFTCSHCGNVQLFAFHEENPPAWVT